MVYMNEENHGLPYQTSTAICVPHDMMDRMSCENFNSANLPVNQQISTTTSQNGRKRSSIVSIDGTNVDLSGLTREERRSEIEKNIRVLTLDFTLRNFSFFHHRQDVDVQRKNIAPHMQRASEFASKHSMSLSPSCENSCQLCRPTRNSRRLKSSSSRSATSPIWIMYLSHHDPSRRSSSFGMTSSMWMAAFHGAIRRSLSSRIITITISRRCEKMENLCKYPNDMELPPAPHIVLGVWASSYANFMNSCSCSSEWESR